MNLPRILALHAAFRSGPNRAMENGASSKMNSGSAYGSGRTRKSDLYAGIDPDFFLGNDRTLHETSGRDVNSLCTNDAAIDFGPLFKPDIAVGLYTSEDTCCLIQMQSLRHN